MFELRVDGVEKYFKIGGMPVKVLDNINFSIRDGELVGLLGPNGTGKSTLINVLTGVYIPDKGKIFLNEEEITGNIEKIKKTVMKPFILYCPRFSVYQVLKLTAKYFNVKNYKEKIDYFLEYFGMEKDKYNEVQRLSTGTYQKLLIISALLAKPKVIILDEITNGMDIIIVRKLLELLKQIRRDFNVSILFSSHIFSHIEMLCERIIIMYNGKIIKDLPISELPKLKNSSSVLVKLKSSMHTKQLLEFAKSLPYCQSVLDLKNNVLKILTSDPLATIKDLINNERVKKIIDDLKIEKLDLENLFLEVCRARH